MRANKAPFALLLLFFLVATFARYGWTFWGSASREDLSPLTERSRSMDFYALIRAIKGKVPPEGRFSFVVLGDSRSNGEVAKKVLTGAKSEDPLFILHTGDLVSKGRVDEYLNYYIPLTQLVAPVPVLPVPGNHEKGPGKDFAGFRALYGADRFSFDYSQCRFVGINNGDSDGLSEDDLKFLERELSPKGAKYKFVIAHIPPAFVQEACSEEMKGVRGFTANARPFHNLMKRMGVQEVFLGHNHGYSSRLIDGVCYTITGGAGANLYENLACMEAIHHYVVIHVEPQGIHRELVRLDEDNWVREEIK